MTSLPVIPDDVPACEFRTGEQLTICFCHAPGIKPPGRKQGIPKSFAACRRCPIPQGGTMAILLPAQPANNGSASIISRRAKRQAANEERKLRESQPCTHLGVELRQEKCGCASKTPLPILACAVHGECVLNRVQADSVKDVQLRKRLANQNCQTCGRYSPA